MIDRGNRRHGFDARLAGRRNVCGWLGGSLRGSRTSAGRSRRTLWRDGLGGFGRRRREHIQHDSGWVCEDHLFDPQFARAQLNSRHGSLALTGERNFLHQRLAKRLFLVDRTGVQGHDEFAAVPFEGALLETVSGGCVELEYDARELRMSSKPHFDDFGGVGRRGHCAETHGEHRAE